MSSEELGYSLFRRLVMIVLLSGSVGLLAAQYVVRGGEGTPLAVEQSAADKAERITVYVVNARKTFLSVTPLPQRLRINGTATRLSDWRRRQFPVHNQDKPQP